MTKLITAPTADPALPPYNRDAIFDADGPIDPVCVQQAICIIIRNTPIDPGDAPAEASRRTVCAMRAFAALHPRDEIEVMLGVQALCAYHAADACWRLGANPRLSDSDKSRYVSKAATAVRTFDTLLRAIERRQAKPLAVPIGRPAPQVWDKPDPDKEARALRDRCGLGAIRSAPGPTDEEAEAMTDDEIITTWANDGNDYFADENEGLDLANTEGILPGGGMIMPEEPDDNQAAYIQRRLKLMYLREKQENDRLGNGKKIVFRPLRTGALVK